MPVYKFSNAGGFTSKQRYTSVLAGNPKYAPPFSADFLVVAGGGGGGYSPSVGSRGAAGGGAGGYRYLTSQTLLGNTNYSVVVGAGGSQSSVGNPSTFNTTSASGGGRGGNAETPGSTVGGSGGSGGGAGENGSGYGTAGGSGNVGGYTPVEGYAGSNNYSGGGGGTGGGGGGAGGVGGTGALAGQANPGPGVANSITGTSITYAVGGTGGAADTRANGADGTANRGNGGGGGAGAPATYTTQSGGSGGSGVVIVRWPVSSGLSMTVGAGLTADAQQTDGSFYYRRITAGSGQVSFN